MLYDLCNDQVKNSDVGGWLNHHIRLHAPCCMRAVVMVTCFPPGVPWLSIVEDCFSFSRWSHYNDRHTMTMWWNHFWIISTSFRTWWNHETKSRWPRMPTYLTALVAGAIHISFAISLWFSPRNLDVFGNMLVKHVELVRKVRCDWNATGYNITSATYLGFSCLFPGNINEMAEIRPGRCFSRPKNDTPSAALWDAMSHLVQTWAVATIPKNIKLMTKNVPPTIFSTKSEVFLKEV